MDVTGKLACLFERRAKPILLNVHMVGVKVNNEIIDPHHSEIFTCVFAGIAEIGFITVHWLDPKRHTLRLSIAAKLSKNVGNLLLFVVGRRLPGQSSKVAIQATEKLFSPKVSYA